MHSGMDLVVYFLSVIGMTLAFAKLYVGKFIRELISGIKDEQFYEEVGTEKEDRQRMARKVSDSWCLHYKINTGVFLKWCEGWSFRQSYIGRLVRCPACSGFWIGLLIACLRFLDLYSVESYILCVSYALGGSALSLLFWGTMVKFGIMEWG